MLNALLQNPTRRASTPVRDDVPSVNFSIPHHRSDSAESRVNSGRGIGGIHRYKLPVTVQFPCFGGPEDDTDPLTYLEKCEEFLVLQPLSNEGVLATLNTVLKGTAKDWWRVERSKIRTWAQFKTAFLRSFLSEDYEAEGEKRLWDQIQGQKEGIRDFAFQYRALCMC